MLSLTVEKRAKGDNIHALRKAGRLPAVFYGPKEENTPISVPTIEFKKILKSAGESSVIILKDGGEEHEALIHEVDFHPVTDEPRHADFYVIEKGKKVQVEIPLVFDGVSPAVKDMGGILIKVLRVLHIEAAPRDLPHEVSIDISKLAQLNDVIHAKDVALPNGVELLNDPEEVVASVAEAKDEPIEAPTLDVSAIEVEAKGKEAKEGEEGADGAAPAESPESKKKE